MENAERLVNKTAEIHEFASEVARMITGAQMPEFSSENISVSWMERRFWYHKGRQERTIRRCIRGVDLPQSV